MSVQLAKKIRTELKEKFPEIRFWVTSKNSINISWIDGVTTKAVEGIVSKYESISKCEASGEILSGGNQYIFCKRLYSEAALKSGISIVKEENYAIWIGINWDGIEFKPEWDGRGDRIVHKQEYTIYNGYRRDLIEDVIAVLRTIDLSNKSEPIEVDSSIESEDKTQEILEQRADRFNQRKERRIECYNQLAVKHQDLSNAAYNESKKMASVIPFGQPILVGHHSEGRDRRYRSKIWDKMGQSVKHESTAKYYAEKAETAQHNNAISSDDPEAIAKIKKEIEELEHNQASMKKANGIIRKKNLTKDQKIKSLNDAGFDGDTLMNPKWHYAEGYQGFELSNNNANINRLKKRLIQLQEDLIAAADLGDTNQEYPEVGLTVIQARSINRLQLKFKGKPSSEVRSILKSNGFRWAPSEVAWQRFLKNSDYALRNTLDELNKAAVLN